MRTSSNMETSTSSVSMNGIGMNSYKNIQAIMQTATKGEVRDFFPHTRSFLVSIFCLMDNISMKELIETCYSF